MFNKKKKYFQILCFCQRLRDREDLVYLTDFYIFYSEFSKFRGQFRRIQSRERFN